MTPCWAAPETTTLIGGFWRRPVCLLPVDMDPTASNGGTGTWIDAIALDQSGGASAAGHGTGQSIWTSGSILQQTQNELTFSNDADGTLNFTDGSTIAFTDIERVQW